MISHQVHLYVTHEFWLRSMHLLDNTSRQLELPVSDSEV
jgi:hypothetical protein